ncbi:hypothetical protein [Streptomyces mayteni]
MRRGRILALTTIAVLAAGMTTAGATVDHGGTADAAKPEAAPLAAHGQYIGPPESITPGSFSFAYATCPAGQVPTGGGGGTSNVHIYLTDSHPTPNGWVVGGVNTGSLNESLTAHVVCTVP